MIRKASKLKIFADILVYKNIKDNCLENLALIIKRSTFMAYPYANIKNVEYLIVKSLVL